MAWTVRNEHGSLDFANYNELRQACSVGLVSGEDEVREPGSQSWRKVRNHPRLSQIPKEKRAGSSPVPFPVILLAVALSAVALYFVASGAWVWGLAIALAVTALLMRINRRAFGTRGPRTA
jgi:hypothetical protein